jgi:hypothetical protein
MRAVYDIRNCRGDLAQSVEVDAYGDLAFDDTYERCVEVCEDAGYDTRAKCGGCGDCRYHVAFSHYVGQGVSALNFEFTDGSVYGDISGATRHDLIVALEAILTELRGADDCIGFVHYDSGKVSQG